MTAVWLKTVLVCGAHIFLTWGAYKFVLAGYVVSKPLAAAFAFLLVQFSAIVTLLSLLYVKRLNRQIHARRAERIVPSIRRALAGHAAGSDRRPAIQKLQSRNRAELELCMAEFLRSVRGHGHARLAKLAVELGFAAEWADQCGSRSVAKRRKAAALVVEINDDFARRTLRGMEEDPDENVRADVFRYLLRVGTAADATRIFGLVCYQRPITRALLIEDLERHLEDLQQRAIPDALESNDAFRLQRTLEMIGAWRKLLSVRLPNHVLRHPSPVVRAQALRVLRYVASDQDFTSHVRAGLADENERVQAAAAYAAGRLKIESAVPALKNFLDHRSAQVALTAAFSLAEIGEAGMKVLEDALLEGSGVASGAALEVIEKVRIGRHGYANL